MKKTIGILGGMGPLATADLYRKIIERTRADRDNEHIRVYIDGNAAIPDRTAAILHGGEDPVPEMLSALRHLEACGADCIIMPCNTAHYFLPRLREQTALPILDMQRITAAVCRERFPGKTAAILATDGTVQSGLYDRALDAEGVRWIHPGESEQKSLMHLIYGVVKASRPMEPEKERWDAILDTLRGQGADLFILGCTELPVLAGVLPSEGPFLDPTDELAKAAIRFCGYEVKE
ncbi:MAG: amino acid racemase [Oscillospiraceae bacterium]|jgi:aspartate racemase|nr:amino acid racemase [Oscillospiraceae bacterium]MBQ5787545.1 amino acid racemase [Oscillospiraceae bacterium]